MAQKIDQQSTGNISYWLDQFIIDRRVQNMTKGTVKFYHEFTYPGTSIA